MTIILFILASLGLLSALAMFRAPLIAWAGGAAFIALAAFGFAPQGGFGILLAFLPALALAALSVPALRLAVL
ncbi:MAG: hypothetical protein AAFZ02_13975, partial [Pseudomonadota bacterium]